MSFKTIQCGLVVDEPIRRKLWDLMANKNTPLVNELLEQVSQHANFETWQRWGTVSEASVQKLCQPLRTDHRFENQPGRFYSSASRMVTYAYQSWLALQKKRRLRLDGKRRWLEVVQSDAALVQTSGCDLEIIQAKAQEILGSLNAEESSQKARPTRRKKPNLKVDRNLIGRLFETHESTKDTLIQCAIAHLLKNDCRVNELEENPEKFADRIHRKQKEIEQLEAKLVSRLPKGRDLTGERFIETLRIATEQVPESEVEQRLWQAKLLAKPATLPYPILFGSQDDLRWSMNEKGRLCVAFNGVEKFIPELKETPFQIYCDQRQLPTFEKFLQDWQAHLANEATYPLSLFLLKTASLGWEEEKGKGDPWTVNRLTLHCTINPDLLTAEGTERVQQESIAKFTTQLSKAVEQETLTKGQQESIKRQRSSLARLQNPPQRPSKLQYQGCPEIVVGVSIGLDRPITAAVVNLVTGQALTYRSTRQLLGDNYRLLNRQRQQQQHNTIKRHKNQTKGHINQPSESELGQYVDRLLANSIIELAQQFQASCIVLPQTKNLREHLSAEINARAEKKSDSKQVQDKYVKEVRMSIHCWSYNRLLTAISTQAEKTGLAVETITQPLQGTPQQKAKDVAIAAYHFRQVSSN